MQENVLTRRRLGIFLLLLSYFSFIILESVLDFDLDLIASDKSFDQTSLAWVPAVPVFVFTLSAFLISSTFRYPIRYFADAALIVSLGAILHSMLLMSDVAPPNGTIVFLFDQTLRAVLFDYFEIFSHQDRILDELTITGKVYLGVFRMVIGIIVAGYSVRLLQRSAQTRWLVDGFSPDRK